MTKKQDPSAQSQPLQGSVPTTTQAGSHSPTHPTHSSAPACPTLTQAECDKIKQCLCDPDCCKFCCDNLPAECQAKGIACPTPQQMQSVGVSFDWLLPFLPIILDLIKKWLDTQVQPMRQTP